MARPTDIRLTVTGRLLQRGDRLILQMEDIKAQARNTRSAGQQHPIPEQPSFDLLAYADKRHPAGGHEDVLLELGKQAGKTIELEGYWRDTKNGETTQTLLVTRLVRALPD